LAAGVEVLMTAFSSSELEDDEEEEEEAVFRLSDPPCNRDTLAAGTTAMTFFSSSDEDELDSEELDAAFFTTLAAGTGFATDFSSSSDDDELDSELDDSAVTVLLAFLVGFTVTVTGLAAASSLEELSLDEEEEVEERSAFTFFAGKAGLTIAFGASSSEEELSLEEEELELAGAFALLGADTGALLFDAFAFGASCTVSELLEPELELLLLLLLEAFDFTGLRASH